MKKYTSVKIRQKLKSDGRNEIVNELQNRKAGQKHKVWKDRFDAVIIRNSRVLLTKLKYIHNNPVKKELVEKAEDWKYSSARYYLTEIEGVMPVKHAWKII